jgi:hypothetical protein
VFLAVEGLALLVIIGVMVATIVFSTRGEARLRDHVANGSTAIVTGQAAVQLTAGRLVRTRPAPGRPAFGLATPWPIGVPASIAVFTALPPEGPARRVAALIPASFGLRKGQSAVLGLHPGDAEVAVLDDRVSQEQLAHAAADPRWTSERLPTDASVVGGWLSVIAISLATLVVVAAVVIGITALVHAL